MRLLGSYEGEASPVRVALDGLERQDPLQGAHAARAELGAGRTAKLLEGLCGRAGGAVDACRQHRDERVGHVDDPGAESDSIAAVERSLSSLFASSSETFCDWIVSAAWRSF